MQRECALLRAAGHQVVTYFRHNDEVDHGSLSGKMATVPKAIWASDSYHELSAILCQEKPDLAHFHNTFPLISPSAYYPVAASGTRPPRQNAILGNLRAATELILLPS